MFNAKTTLAAAAVTSIAAMSLTGVASAAMVRGSLATTSPTLSPTTTALRTTPSIPIPPPVTSAPTTTALTAFPAGGKGSGTEATCALWSGQLNEDQGAIDAAEANNDVQQYKDAVQNLADDKDNALDAGCVVID